MILIWGQQNYGKVDAVPRLFYVATRFFHLYYVPLIPLASFVIVAGTEKGEAFQGLKIPLSWKSVLAGWVRAVLILCMVAGGFAALLFAVEAWDGIRGRDFSSVTVPLVLCVLSAFAFWMTKSTGKAGYDRAHNLGQLLGLPPQEIDRALGIEPDLHAAEAASEYRE